MNTKIYSHLKSLLLLSVFTLSTLFTMAQDRRVTGKVAGSDGQGIPGVSVFLKGTKTGTTSDASGAFALNLTGGKDILVFSGVGYKSTEVKVGSQSNVNITLNEDVSALEEVVVTGYQTLRKRDITGAVTVIEAEGLKSVQSGSFTQNLAGRAPGVTISTSGSPGDATNVRIRGISSFTSNDPLYIIDGVPVKDQYQNTVNPDDIESIQVLKDASTSSIYGSRASNGVIVITTKQGKSGKTKVSYNASFGLATSVKGYSDVLNQSSKDYATAMLFKYPLSSGSTPLFAQNPSALPKYINPQGNTVDESTYDPINNQISLTNQTGTDWWKLITQTAQIHKHSISLSGGNDKANFAISGSYLRQEGVLMLTDYNLATVRANASFKVTKSFRIGENMTYASNWGVGQGSAGGGNNEQGIIGNILKATPVIPQYDIKGNPGGHVFTALTGNFTNPDQKLINNKDNTNKYNRMLGNIYAELDVIKGLTLRTSFGIDVGQGFNRNFTYPEPYRIEGAKTSNSFNESWNQSFTYTWTNTANYTKEIGSNHRIGVLIGQEAIANTNRNIYGALSSYFTTDVNAWYLNTAFGDPTSRQVSSGGSQAKLSSYFGKVDYSYADKYLISATIRRDGSSKFTSDVRYGVFPAVSLGWRVSNEGFMKELPFISDLKLRASYGELGNQDIRNYNFANIYGGSIGSSFYNISGDNASVATGYALQSRGNASTVWESSKTSNFGIDAAFLNNSLTAVLDIYTRNTSNLLYNPALPGTAGAATPPFVNIGAMRNTGFDLALNYRKSLTKDLSFNVGLNLSHYKNEIVSVSNNDVHFIPNDGLDGRLDIPAFDNRVGYAISSFRGFVADGLIKTEAERTANYVGSVIGGIKFKDINGDGKIDDNDRTIIGSPHPSLTTGLNLGVNYKNFDFTAFLFGSFGNDIFNYTKMFTYFTNFNSNIGKDVLALQGTGNNPLISGSDLASRASSTFYIENGSYVRLANLQVGYKLPKTLADKIGLAGARIYLQGQNLFTITGYSGVDPAVSSANIGGGSNVSDSSKMGFDGGHYPANKVMTLGLNINF